MHAARIERSGRRRGRVLIAGASGESQVDVGRESAREQPVSRVAMPHRSRNSSVDRAPVSAIGVTSGAASFAALSVVLGCACGAPPVPRGPTGNVAPAAGSAAPPATTFARLSFPVDASGAEISTWILRAPQADGSAQIAFHATGAAKPLQPLVVVPFARDAHAIADAEISEIKTQAFELPDGQRAVRIDTRLAAAGGAERTETTLVGFRGDELHRLLEISSGSARSRSASCREVTETSLRFSAPGRPVVLEAMTFMRLEPVPDAGAPDATCTGKRPVKRSLFKLDGDRLVEIEEDDHD